MRLLFAGWELIRDPRQARHGDVLFTAHHGSLIDAIVRWATEGPVTHCGTVLAGPQGEGERMMLTHEILPDGVWPRLRRESTGWKMEGKRRAPTVLLFLRPPEGLDLEAISMDKLKKTGANYNYVGVVRLGYYLLVMKVRRLVDRNWDTLDIAKLVPWARNTPWRRKDDQRFLQLFQQQGSTNGNKP
jgi:hypothetical protein